MNISRQIHLCKSFSGIRMAAWKRAVENQKSQEKLFFDKDHSELLTRNLKLEGFPTYMIINKNRRIVDRPTPRPSSGNIVRELFARYF